ncbi:AraC family transcriptional regulator [Maricurvus nonylphenolicus]|uniref:AraC family transcriptional regulator n=1 Tax=Maricurvus nonylphenolicus TaxID=1008307 RepID=UPI0036F3BC90
MGDLAGLMQSYADLKSLNTLEGSCRTAIPGVYFYRAAQGSGRQALVYQSGIIVMAQGRKEIYLDERSVCYGPGDYLVLGVPLPLECEAFSEGDLPILSLSINVDSQTLHKLVSQLNADIEETGSYVSRDQLQLGIRSQCMSDAMQNTFQRLLLALHDDTEARILGPAIVEEIIYRVLIGANGHILFDLARHDGHYARIAKTLKYLHRQYADPITVEALAERANMSVSGFHRAFRQVTSETPLQYLKKVRLSKARDLIASEGRRANDAAMLVGYASPSQFSREFKRHFNMTPKAIQNS